MNDLAKKLLGSCSGQAITLTPEQLEERRLRLYRANRIADRAYWKWYDGQVAGAQRVLGDPTCYSG